MLRPRRRLRLAVLVAAIVVVGGCGRDDDNANGGLGGTAWTVVSVGGQPTLVDARPTLDFVVDGTLSGTSGCNQYSGRFRTDSERISVGQLTSTMMGCEADRMAQEEMFNAALSEATTWRQTETGNLEMAGVMVIVAEPASAERPTPAASGLASTAWNLVELGETADLARLVPTIEFGADGTVSGFAGCNTFSGMYAVDGDDLRLGPLATTKMACERPASAVEAEVLAALSAVTTWSIGDDGRLVLSGGVPLTYAPG